MARVVCIGSALQDIYLIDRDDFKSARIGSASIFSEITIGTKVDIDKISFEVGGGGTNAAATLVRHGHQVIFMGNIGDDPAGAAVIDFLDDEGIDTSYVHVTKRYKTGVSVVLLDMKTGERTILTHRGASAHFSNLDEHDLDLIDPDWLYVTSLKGDMETLIRIFEYAKKKNIKIMFNPGKLELEHGKQLLSLLDCVDVLLVNKLEASELVPGQVLEELVAHLGAYVPVCIITDGNMGGIATNHARTYRFGIYEDVKVRDTTGAGDAFGSGFLAHFADGHSLKDSLVFASANSTSVVSILGAKHGILTGKEDLHPMPIQEIR